MGLLVLLAAAAATARDGIGPDDPISSSYSLSLDGIWTASTVAAKPTPSANGCTFVNDTDYNPPCPQCQPVRWVKSAAACCQICERADGCVAATYCLAGSGCDASCYTHTAEQAAGGTYTRAGRVACAVKPSPPGPPPGPPAFSINASVPGDIISDLEAAGLVGDPLRELNFKNATLWAGYTWAYHRCFTAPPAVAGTAALLVFDGIKMGAVVELNGLRLGVATDQFLRYNYTLPAGLLKAGADANAITVTFNTSTNGRYMGCTGGWDWGPYSSTYEGLDHTFSFGLWKSVSLVLVDPAAAAIKHVVPRTYYTGAYAVTPLVPHQHAGFNVTVDVHVWSARGSARTQVEVAGSWATGARAATTVALAGGDQMVTLELTASAADIELWWPINCGTQTLYNITATVGPATTLVTTATAGAARASRLVGFRTVALVTGNDTDPVWVKQAAGSEGSGSHGMMLRINGAAVMARGGNVIPMDNMEARFSAAAHRQMVLSAAAGGMNFLRIWGGGVFLPTAFYDAADAAGVLIFHDMMYTTTSQTHVPHDTVEELLELRYNVRRLGHHPSIVVWNACNECSGTGLYASFVMTTVAQEDDSRPIWPSCPSGGWATGVHALDSRPNGNPLTRSLVSPTLRGGLGGIEQHGPYANGNGWPAVNQAPFDRLDVRPTDLPILVPQPADLSPRAASVFTSEFGASAFSSFESMAPTLAQEHWGVHGGAPVDNCEEPDKTNGFWKVCKGGNVMAERNYPCDNLIIGYFGTGQQLDLTGEVAFKRQLYQCMVAQALAIKSNIEQKRAANKFGIVTWQLNEIWPTGGWGSIEYGTVGWTAGNVLGGRWKPLHHFMANHLYADLITTCGYLGDHGKKSGCFVRNDGIRAFEGTVVVAAVPLSGKPATEPPFSLKVSLGPGPGAVEWFGLPSGLWGLAAGGDHVYTSDITAAGSGHVVSHHVILPAAPKDLNLSRATTVAFAVASSPDPDDGTVDVTVTASGGGVALYVLLTTAAQGRFSDNAFLVFPNAPVAIKFIPFPGFELEELRRTIRIEHLAGNTIFV